MQSKTRPISNFSKALHTTSHCYRPDKESDLFLLSEKPLLARGRGLSYGDCCLNDKGGIIDTSRLNHLLAFDQLTQIVECQGGVSFADLFQVHADYIPPVIPGTVHATIAGGIANDVHGKNNQMMGSFGQHIAWITLQTHQQTQRISKEHNRELFQATIAGLGLTGVIVRAGIILRKASRWVRVQKEKHTHWQSLLDRMQQLIAEQEYQVAWLDFLETENSLLSMANHCAEEGKQSQSFATVPPLPFPVIAQWNLRLFNRYYFKWADLAPNIQPLTHFNNPLDSVNHWNRLYGKQGLLQFQAVFDITQALDLLREIRTIIHHHQAIPTLAVLKIFTQNGSGLLSFTQPGFTLAVDFINNEKGQMAVKALNNLITHAKGKVYLAKDWLLTPEQFTQQYPNQDLFKKMLPPHSALQSDLARRLRLVV